VKGCGEAGAIGSPPAFINAADRRAGRARHRHARHARRASGVPPAAKP
jgi:CO/xanthine dehydrogenase Mo-binding subunit